MKKNNAIPHLLTPEGEALHKQIAADPSYIPWNEYPRPMLKRDSFYCLNGRWSFRAEGVETPEEILVPFPPESLLSGICADMGERPRLHYQKTFVLPTGFARGRVILHFGAVDQVARVTLNGHFAGEHVGGYNAFSFDVTHLLKNGENRLEVDVSDDLPDHILPWGKQKRDRGGMWYTPVSGIWQTVWLECVPEQYIRSLRITADTREVIILADGVLSGNGQIQTPQGELPFLMEKGMARVTIPHPRLWSPEDPYLYRFTLTCGEDRVESYFALRKIESRTVDGIPRLCLNGKPYFFHGLLDQGYFSDGIYTPADPVCFTNEIRAMKDLGFNMLRKHIKVEHSRFYYDCDRLGMVVFQDMVNNGAYSFLRDTALPTAGIKRWRDQGMHRDPRSRAAFERGMCDTVEQLFNHPSVCYWTVFNEGWGQFQSDEMYQKLTAMDNTRIVDSTSGWFWNSKTDVKSLHVYFKPVRLPKNCPQPVVLSEFGGYACGIRGHMFHPDKEYGYRFFKKKEDFEEALISLYEKEIIPALPQGLCATVLTQVSDVEDETNGLYTYDRRVCKVNVANMKKIADQLQF